MKKLLAKAIKIAVLAHDGQFDKGGQPYILHPIWVMNKVRHLGPEYMIAAILHDAIEDTDEKSPINVTFKYLKEEGFPFEIITTLMFLTHQPGVEYVDYIENMILNKVAREVKLRDLEHNSKITRLKGLRPKDFDRLVKYNKAYDYLKSC